MMRVLAVVAAALFAAGCLSGTETHPQEANGDGVLIDEARPRESFGDVVTGPAVPPDLNATTQQAPNLILGEWWRVRFSSYLDGADIEVVRIVADVNDEGYVMGMPHEGWLKEAIAFHSPAFGDVHFDLSYNTHNVLFEPVRFPLTVGETWETEFATTPFVATVTEADTYTATIEFNVPESSDPDDALLAMAFPGGEGPDMVLTYDARMHEIVKMVSAIGTWEVLEHGYDFEGWVTVPRGEHTAIDYGVFGGPVGDRHDPLPREILVEGGFNRLTMMHLIVPLSPGQFRIRDVTPNGTEFVTEATVTAEAVQQAFIIEFYEASDPDGRWMVEDTIVGAGVTYSMGIAYHQYDIRLPDGLRRADHSHEVIR